MIKSLSEKIAEDRWLKQNPYAHLNDFGQYSAYSDASSSDITESRLLLQNPYAYLNGSGNFSGLANDRNLWLETFDIPLKKDHYSDIEIEQLVRSLQVRMWQKKSQVWGSAAPSNPVNVLDPVIALKLLGYDYDLDETLGQFYSDGKPLEVAGTIDKTLKRVRISRQFSQNIRSFTAAHELGHALLHNTAQLHRDRPLDGSSVSRNATEFEADKFATFFLMPRKLVQTVFERMFLTNKFYLNEATSFALGYDYLELKKKHMSLRQLSRMLVSTKRYNGRQFNSLADQFRVSTEAMAIRLEELELLGISE